MAKASVAQRKADAGYTKNAPGCQNCKHFTSTTQVNSYGWAEEKDMKCLLHHFVTKKTTWCLKHAFK